MAANNETQTVLSLCFKKVATKLMAVILSNLNRFSKPFHCYTQRLSCSKAVMKDPTSHKTRRYNTLLISENKQQFETYIVINDKSQGI